jgi:hypothetical protein
LLDLLAANSGSGSVSVMLGDGRGGFRAAPGSPVAAGPAPHLLAVGDVNADGRPDVAATSHDSNDVYVLLGAGGGRFAPAPGSPVAAFRDVKPHNHGLALADVNGDGKLDLTVGHQEAGRLAVLLGDGRGRFTPAQGSPFPAGRTPYPHAVGDLDNDGKPDVVIPDVRGGAIVVLRGDGRGAFVQNSPVKVEARPFFVLLEDINQDGKLDVVATHDDIRLVTVLLGDGKGNLRPAPGSPFDAGQQGWQIVSGDLNRDGHKDVVISSGSVSAFLGNGRGSFAPAPGSPYATAGKSWAAGLGDINQDNKLDIAAPDSEGNSVTILLGR